MGTTIGNLTLKDDGSYEGTLATLMVTVPIAIVPNGRKMKESEADFLVGAAVKDLGDYERLLLDRILAIEPVTDARSTFAIRTVLSHGPLPVS